MASYLNVWSTEKGDPVPYRFSFLGTLVDDPLQVSTKFQPSPIYWRALARYLNFPSPANLRGTLCSLSVLSHWYTFRCPSASFDKVSALPDVLESFGLVPKFLAIEI